MKDEYNTTDTFHNLSIGDKQKTDESFSLPIMAVGSSYYASMSIVIPDLKSTVKSLNFESPFFYADSVRYLM